MKGQISILAVILIIGIVGSSGVSGYLYMQNISLQSKVQTISRDKNNLENKVSMLSTENQQLSKDKDFLEKHVDKLNSIIMKLNVSKTVLEKQVKNLNIIYYILLSRYNELNMSYYDIISKYKTLNQSYYSLLNDYNSLVDQWNSLVDEYNNLTENYDAWFTYAWGVIQFTNETISRVYSQEQYNYLHNIIVNNVSLTNSNDWWLSVYELYQYENKTVQYVDDEPEPMPPYIQDLINGTYRNETCDNSIMSPNETLELGQGDCDDQAILLYGLINTYEKQDLKTDYVEWLVFEEMGNGSGHMTVFIPTKNDGLTIMDPAGHYLTLDRQGGLTSNNALKELQEYSHWWSDYGGVKYIELYKVYNGKAYLVASGDIYKIAGYIYSIQKKSMPERRGITSVKMVIRIEADEEILHYSNETYWSEKYFSTILGIKDRFSSSLINNYTEKLKNFGLEVSNANVEFDEKEMKTIFTCDIKGAMYAKNSYDFTWFLSEFPFDLYAFSQSNNTLTYIGSLNNVEIEIYLIFPFPISHCHAHVWPSG